MEFVDAMSHTREASIAMMETITLYLTVVSGYLIVAYSTGKNLNVFQVSFVTAVFVVFAFFFIVGTNTFISQAHFVASQLFENPNDNYRLMGNIIISAEILGIIGSLWFMYDVKRK
jgi:hypothetical protein